MATDAENYATIKSNTLAQLAEMSANYKPTYTIDGQTVSWTEYQKMLQERVAWCDQKIAASGEYFEVESFGF